MSSAPMTTISRDELLRLTPAHYLKAGYRDVYGAPRKPLRGLYALAAANQLFESHVAPQELGALLEALRQAIELHDGPFPRRFYSAVREAGEIVAGMYRKQVNPGLMNWALECGRRVADQGDFDAFLEHATAVVRNYATLVALKA